MNKEECCKCLWCKKDECRLEFDEWEEYPGQPESMEGGVWIQCIVCHMRSPTYWYHYSDKEEMIAFCKSEYKKGFK